jgi:HSP20 family protein
MANLVQRTRDWFRHENRGSRLPVERGSSGNMQLPASYFGPLSNFFSDMDRMFANAARNFGLPSMATMDIMPGFGMQMFNPNVDITSSDKEYTVTAEMPGLEEGDVKIEVSDGLLTISGEKRQENTDNRRDVYSIERSYGAFERTLSLPDDVDQDNIEARFKNGLLTITCPRMESARQPRRQIPIGGGKASENMRASNANERGAASGQNTRKTA